MAQILTVSLIQMQCSCGDKAKNLTKAEKLIAQATLAKAKLVVLPELFNTGYRVEKQDQEMAEHIPGPTTKWMQEIARNYQTYLCGAIIERDSTGKLYDTAVLIGPDGVIGTHRKMHLWGGEEQRFGHGDKLEVFKLPFATVGMLICYEIGFPEQSRVLTQKGADILIFTSAFGKARAYAWDVASRSRALENGTYVLACNRTGTEADTVMGGLSRVVAPNTQILAGAGADEEAIITATLDLDAVTANRQTLPYLRDLNQKLFITNF